MNCRRTLAAVALAAALAPLAPLRAQEAPPDLERMQEEQEALQRKLEVQQEQLDRVMREQRAVGGATHVVHPSEAPYPSPPDEEDDEDAIDIMHWNEYSVYGHKIKFYGFIRLDVIYDDSRPNNTQTIGFVRSEDRDAPPSIGVKDRNSENYTIHPRLTRFGWDYDGGTIEPLGDMKLTGKLEFDLYTAGFSESRQAIRLRHGYVKMAWGDFSLLAGQTGDLISPLYPNINPDLAMWGAGNLGDRRPQVRAEYKPGVGPGALYLGGMVGLTGADDNQDLDSPGTYGAGYRDGETSGLPTLQARIAYELPVFEAQKLVVGAWVHGGWEDPDTRFGGEGIFKSWAVGIDFKIPLFGEWVWLAGELWQGSNVDDVRGGIFQGINRATGDEIEARGGWIELSVRPGTEWYYCTVGYSTDDPDNSDVGAGGRAQNQIYYIANRFQFGPFGFGLDFMHWITRYNGFRSGRDNRVQGYVSLSW